jgi:hypothetical protein
MELAASARSHRLRESNRQLRQSLDRVNVGCGDCRAASPEEINGLLSQLLQFGASLRAEALPAPGIDPEADAEIEQYRRNVERLRELLPAIHRQLLAERTRIEAQRARLATAEDWARASRQTL